MALGILSDGSPPMTQVQELTERIKAADFVAAVRMLECAAPDKPRLGYASRLRDEPVRLSQHVSLAFLGQELEDIDSDCRSHPHRLHCNFMGLLGSNGPMPVHYTEHALQRAAHHDDPTFLEFIDLFNHRMLSLFYRAIAESDPAINLDRGQSSRYSDYIAAVGGNLSAIGNDRDSLPDVARFNFAGWLGARTRSPSGMQAMVSNYFGLACEIIEFVGDWLPIPQEERLRLGSQESNCELGVSTYAGAKVWSISHKFRIRIGPMNWDEYSVFTPGGKRNRELRDLVKSYYGDEFDWDLELVLHEGEASRLSLDRTQQLGFGWLLSDSNGNGRSLAAVKSRQQLKIKSTVH